MFLQRGISIVYPKLIKRLKFSCGPLTMSNIIEEYFLDDEIISLAILYKKLLSLSVQKNNIYDNFVIEYNLSQN